MLSNNISPIFGADSLKFTSVHIPSLVQRNTNFWLSCQFELAGEPIGGDQLYSVKWYKNNVEFYRYQPSEAAVYTQTRPSQQQQQYFGQAGISIMVSKPPQTSGRYAERK